MKTAHLKIKFSFGVEVDRNQDAISPEQAMAALKIIRAEAARRFGAYTVTAVSGGWKNPAGLLVEELGYALTVVVPENMPNLDVHVTVFAAYIRGGLNQEAVAVTIAPVDFQMHFGDFRS